MRDLIRIIVVAALFFGVSLALAAVSGCATVKKAAPYAARAGVCCAKCVADEWNSYKAAQAEPAPGGAP